MKRLDFRSVVVVLLAAAAGCKGDPTADLRTGVSSVSMNPDVMFIDIGANVGIYAIYAALHAGPGARIIAVEPHPLALERLRCNVRLNQLTNIAIEPMALNDRSGTVTFRPNRLSGRDVRISVPF